MTTAGIDIPINEVVDTFISKLWTGLGVTFRGRVYRNEKDRDLQNFIIPEYYDYDLREYQPVETDDGLGGIGFVDVIPTAPIEGNPEADVRFCFALNLDKLYPGEGTRATEQAHRDVQQILVGSSFELTSLVRGAPAFSDYGHTKQTGMDMHPFYLFRFDTKLEYEINICYE